MNIIILFSLLILFSYVLIKATEFLVDSLNDLSKSAKIGKYALTSVVVALATSLPELFVCVVAALEAQQNLALGNILGSNIANLSLVIGGAVLLGGTINVNGNLFKKDLLAVFFAAVLPLFLLLDNTLSRVDGLFLLLIFGVYNYSLLRDSSRVMPGKKYGILTRLADNGSKKKLAWVFIGLATMLIAADIIVKISSGIAQTLHLPLLLIGLFFVAIGTSLPELSFSIKAIREKQTSMVFGDLIGSVVANSTFILGLTALISPIKVNYMSSFSLATIFFLIIYFLFWVFIRSKRKLERWEAGVLVLVYLLFIFLEFFKDGKF